jgi:hypothetical protein
MRASRRRLAVGTRLFVIVACAALFPSGASAQDEAGPAWAIVPSLGFGTVRVNESWNSGGAEAALDVEYGDSDWRAGGFASLRGIGVGCSESCFEGGPAFALGAARSVGALWLGGGVGTMKQHGSWRFLPYGRISFDAAPLRVDLRIEWPQQDGSGVYLPLLIGMPIGRATAGRAP